MKKMIPVSCDVYRKRREILAKLIQPREAVLIIGGGDKLRNALDNVYPFRQDSNMYYLTGIKEQDSAVLLYKSEKGLKTIVFVMEKDPDKEKWNGYRLGKEKAIEISGADEAVYVSSMDTTVSWYAEMLSVLYVNFNYNNNIHALTNERMDYINKLRVNQPHLLVKNALQLMKKLRVSKSALEVRFMREAVRITRSALYRTWRKMKPGMYEYELAAMLEYEFKRQGGQVAFNSIVASGAGAVVLHYCELDRRIDDGELVLFDLGAEFDLYSADISRTVPINGKFTDIQKKYYQLVLDANKKVIDAAVAGTTLNDLNTMTKTILADGMKKIGKIKDESELGKYYYHGVGHHLGLDTHDLGNDRGGVLPVNAVITVEPGIYVKEDGIGIRIEDDVVVKRNGSKNISSSIIKEVSDIEAFLK